MNNCDIEIQCMSGDSTLYYFCNNHLENCGEVWNYRHDFNHEKDIIKRPVLNKKPNKCGINRLDIRIDIRI